MALPLTVQAQAGVPGHNPPHKSSGGNYYFVTGNGTTAIEVEKTADPAATASVIQDAAGNPTESPDACLASVSDGTYIHVTYIDSTNLSLEYSRFNMSTDNWDQVDSVVADLSGKSAPAIPWCSIALRAGVTGDELVIAASGLTDSNMGSDYERVDFWHGADTGTPSWTGPVSIDAGVAGESEQGIQLAVGTNDQVHFLYIKRTTVPVSYTGKTLSTTNTFSSAITYTGVGANAGEPAALVSYDDGGTQRIAGLVNDGFEIMTALTTTEDGSGNFGSITESGDILTGSHSVRWQNGYSLVVSGVDIYAVYPGGGASGGNEDLYISSSADNGATWSTPTEELDAVTINYISAAVLDTGKIAYLYDDGGTTKYNEIVLAAGDTDVATNLDTLALTEQQSDITFNVDVVTNTGTLTLTELAATVDLGVNVSANLDALVLTELPSAITLDDNVVTTPDSLVLTEQQANVALDVDISANLETLVLAESAAAISYDADVSTNAYALALTEQQADIGLDINVSTNLDALNLTELQATISTVSDTDVVTNAYALALTEQVAAVSLDLDIAADFDVLALAEQQSTVTLDVNISSGLDALVLTEQQAAIGFDVEVATSLDTLALTELAATVIVGGDTNINTNLETLTLAEQQAAIGFDVEIEANLGTLTLAELSTTVTLDVDITASLDTLALTEQQSDIAFNVDITTSLDTLTLTENAATITANFDTNIAANTEILSLSALTSTIGLDINVAAATYNFALTANTASISFSSEILAEYEAMILSGFSAEIIFQPPASGFWRIHEPPDDNEHSGLGFYNTATKPPSNDTQGGGFYNTDNLPASDNSKGGGFWNQ